MLANIVCGPGGSCMLAAFAISLLLFSADPVSTQAEADPTAVAAAPVGDPTVKPTRPGGDRLVCRREAKANSRFTTKVCKTVDEWEARAEAARAAFAEEQQRPMINIGKGN